jgi:tRNA-specific 2-thiouridylase
MAAPPSALDEERAQGIESAPVPEGIRRRAAGFSQTWPASAGSHGVIRLSDKIRALALLSGGLDSSLAIRIMQQQGVEVVALHFKNIFHCGSSEPGKPSFAERSAQALGVELKVLNNTPMIMAAVRNPKHGYGKNLNPCLDCREYMFALARKMLPELGARFLVSGEVLGQRPMSQRADAMRLIDREAGVEGLLLRPLSARVMAETLPEKELWVKRDEMLSIRGRSRRVQYDLAKRLGVTVFSAPAGGCLLTDPGFAARMQDLLDQVPDFVENDVELLKCGRHFRFSAQSRVVVGRDIADNQRLEALARPGDVLVEVSAGGSPTALLRGARDEDVLRRAAALTARYSRSRELPSVECDVIAVVEGPQRGEARKLAVAPASDEDIDRLAVGRVAV